MLKALQAVGLLTLRPDREIVCVVNPRVSPWWALEWLGAPYARRCFGYRFAGLRTRPNGPPVGLGKGRDLSGKITHAATPRRMFAANAAANNRASVQAKSKEWSNVRASCQSPETSENRWTTRSKSGLDPRYAMRTDGPK